MNRRQFVQTALIGSSVAGAMRAASSPAAGRQAAAANSASKLFPVELPVSQWQEFHAAGFERPVAGIIYRPSQAPCCGLPLGGISTGCLDLDVRGVYGFSSAFNPWSQWPHGIATDDCRMPRKAPALQPLLGLAIGGETWVLTTPEVLAGGELHYCKDPNLKKNGYRAVINAPPIRGVRPAREIHYWGHYPVADVEFETEAPVSVGLRAWAPGECVSGEMMSSAIVEMVSGSDWKDTCGTNSSGCGATAGTTAAGLRTPSVARPLTG